jgi:hypothetical protein
MKQLETDAGEAGIGPWFAAEHRNTEHHHVHIVLAARREVSTGTFRALLITRPRLQRMKDAIALEIARQRELEREPETAVREPRPPARPEVVQLECDIANPWQWLQAPVGRRRPRAPSRRHRGHRRVASTLLHLHGLARLARHYRHRMEHELEQDLVRAEREGWVR